MASLEELRASRLAKLKKLIAAGIDPYPISSARDCDLRAAAERFSELEKREKITLAGRIAALRSQGGLAFADLDDGTGRFQALFKKGETPESDFKLFEETADVGDFVEVSGNFFESKRGEKTILARSWRMLSKSLRPLPEKWHGLKDTEERFRRRYLDTLMSPDVKRRFLVRSKIIRTIRAFYDDAGYIEVETPRLQSLAGGATALPFVTRHNALGADFYLTIAQELYLKELLVGGFTKVYEIGRKFRNEGIDATHNPEFTMLESNEAYADAKEGRAFIECLFRRLAAAVAGEEAVSYGGTVIDFAKPFAVISFYDLLRRDAGIAHPESLSEKEARAAAAGLGVAVGPKDSLPKVLDGIYKKACRPKLIQPVFIVDYPVAFNPFAKRTEKDQTLIDRFQLVAGSLELVNAFSELNNPLDQAERYAEQDKKKRAGEGEVSPSDREYLEAMEYGMPPNGGIGIGIDRVVMLFTDAHNIREAILFPTLRPKKA